MMINKQTIDNLWDNKSFQRLIDILRILLFIIVVIILVVLIANINEVKLLSSDPCALCMNKTGAVCYRLTP